MSGDGLASALCIADQWTKMQTQLKESMARLRALIAEAHALNDTQERAALAGGSPRHLPYGWRGMNISGTATKLTARISRRNTL